LKYKALKSFSGLVSMHEGETREITDNYIISDLLKARYIEEVKEAKTAKRTTKKKTP